MLTFHCGTAHGFVFFFAKIFPVYVVFSREKWFCGTEEIQFSSIPVK
jgi:hypothetical protein